MDDSAARNTADVKILTGVRRFSFSPGEKAGMRAGVPLNSLFEMASRATFSLTPALSPRRRRTVHRSWFNPYLFRTRRCLHSFRRKRRLHIFAKTICPNKKNAKFSFRALAPLKLKPVLLIFAVLHDAGLRHGVAAVRIRQNRRGSADLQFVHVGRKLVFTIQHIVPRDFLAGMRGHAAH